MAKLLSFRHAAGRKITVKKTVFQKMKESKRLVAFSLAALIFGMGLLYIFQINKIAIKGYDIKEYENRLAELRKENQKMTIQMADLKSMRNLEKKGGKLSSINMNDVAYMASVSGAVALNK